MKYLFVSTAVLDELHFPDNRPVAITGGGAGLYACAGAGIWDENVHLICGKGDDFETTLSPWFTDNCITTESLFAVQDKTPRNVVTYHSDGEREELPVYGKDHYSKFIAEIQHIEPYCKDCNGLYIFKEADDLKFWEELIHLKKQHGFSILWEISASSTHNELEEQVVEIASQVDIFSINRTEAKKLFDCDENGCIASLSTMGTPLVFYRRGKEGSILIEGGKQVCVPSDNDFVLVDPTGAGNSSSGAALVGYCQGKTLQEIGMMGSISAGYNIQQYGPVSPNGPYIRQHAKDRLNAYVQHVRSGRSNE